MSPREREHLSQRLPPALFDERRTRQAHGHGVANARGRFGLTVDLEGGVESTAPRGWICRVRRPAKPAVVVGRQVTELRNERIGAGWALLQAAGIGLDKAFRGHERPTPLDAYDQLHAWRRRARRRRLLGPCDLDVLTWAFLGALHHRVFRAAHPHEGVRRANGEDVDRLVETLGRGVAPLRSPSTRPKSM